MTLWPDAVRWRLTLSYSAVLGALLILFSAASYSAIARVLANRNDRFLEQARDAFIDELEGEQLEMPTVAEAIRAALSEFRLGDTRFVVYDARLQLIGTTDLLPVVEADGSPDADVPPLELSRLGRMLAVMPLGDRELLTMRDSEGGYRVARARVHMNDSTFVAVAVQARHGMVETLEAIATAYLVAVPIFLLLAGGSGYLLARHSLAPIAAMSRQAKAISGTNPHERLPVVNPRDELGALASLLNDLLGRIAESRERQRRFVADASHELRTPVAIVGAEADVVLSRDHRGEAEYRDAFRVVQDAGRRLSRIVDDLFLLARADAGHLPTRREDLYLGDLTTDVARSVRSIAAARDIRIDVTDSLDAPFVGDEALLGRMLLNLFDNAVKYSPTGSVVAASVVEQNGHYEIAVVDAGPGIPVDAQEQVFERFFRVDKTRSRNNPGATGGAGLGLAIARWIAEAHGGRLTIRRSDDSGSEFRVTLPKPVQPGASDDSSSGVAPG